MRILPGVATMLMTILPISAGQARDDAFVPGTITVVVDDPGGSPPVDAIFDEAVRHALLVANFVVLPGSGHGRYIARLSISHRSLGVVETRVGREPAQAGGASLSFGLASHTSELPQLAETKLDVRIFRNGAAPVVWHGAALTTAIDGTVSGQPSVVARKLADALFRQFPMTSDTPIAVP
jgi:hypothetical protein